MCLHKNYDYTIEYIMNELDMLDGWLLYSYAIINDPVAKFGGLRMKTSPSANESDKLLKEIVEYNQKNKNKS